MAAPSVDLRAQQGTPQAPPAPAADDVMARMVALVQQSGMDPGMDRDTNPHVPAAQVALEAPETEEAAEPAPVAAAEEDASGFVSTMADIAEQFGADESEFMQSIRVDGHDGPISLADMRESYLAQPGAAETLRQKDTLESDYRAKRERLNADHEAKLMEATQLAAVMNRQLVGQRPSDEEMARLKISDPARHDAIALRHYEHEKILRESVAALDKEMADRTAELQQDNVEWTKREEQKLQAKYPELSKPDKAETFGREMLGFLRENGFSEDEVLRMQGQRGTMSLHDSRMVIILREAIEGAALRKSGKKALEAKRDKGLPIPAIRPSARKGFQTKTQAAQNKRADIVEKMAKMRGAEQGRSTIDLAQKAFEAMYSG